MDSAHSAVRSKIWPQPWIYAASGAQACCFILLHGILAAGISGEVVSFVIAVSGALPSLLLLIGFRPTLLRMTAGFLLAVSVIMIGLSGNLTTYIYLSMLLLPILTAVLLPAAKLRTWTTVIWLAILVAVAAALLFATMVFVPYPFGWIVVVAPFLGLAGGGGLNRYQTLLPFGLAGAYGLSLIITGPFSAAATVSGCIGSIGLLALLLLAKTESGSDASPYPPLMA